MVLPQLSDSAVVHTSRHFLQAAAHVIRASGWRMRVRLGALRAFMRKSAEDQQASRHTCTLVSLCPRLHPC